MEDREILFLEFTFLQEAHGQRVAQCQHRSAAGGGGEVERTRLAADGNVEMHIGTAGEGRIRVARDGNERDTGGLKVSGHLHQLGSFPTVGEGDHSILFGDDAKIAVGTVGGVEEQCRSSGAAECGRDFLTDQSTFSESCHHHFSGTVVQQNDRLLQFRTQPCYQLFQPRDFCPEGGAGALQH